MSLESSINFLSIRAPDAIIKNYFPLNDSLTSYLVFSKENLKNIYLSKPDTNNIDDSLSITINAENLILIINNYDKTDWPPNYNLALKFIYDNINKILKENSLTNEKLISPASTDPTSQSPTTSSQGSTSQVSTTRGLPQPTTSSQGSTSQVSSKLVSQQQPTTPSPPQPPARGQPQSTTPSPPQPPARGQPQPTTSSQSSPSQVSSILVSQPSARGPPEPTTITSTDGPFVITEQVYQKPQPPARGQPQPTTSSQSSPSQVSSILVSQPAARGPPEPTTITSTDGPFVITEQVYQKPKASSSSSELRKYDYYRAVLSGARNNGKIQEFIDMLRANPNIVNLIEERNGNMYEGDSLLHQAARWQDKDIALELLRLGANPLAKNKIGKTAADIAQGKNNKDIVEAINSFAGKETRNYEDDGKTLRSQRPFTLASKPQPREGQSAGHKKLTQRINKFSSHKKTKKSK